MSQRPVSKRRWWRVATLLPVVIATIVLLSVLPTLWCILIVLAISCCWGWCQDALDRWGDRTFE